MNYQTNGTGASAIDPVWEQDYLLSISKEQERTAIRGILRAMKFNIRQKGETQETDFKNQAKAIKDYLGQTVTKNLVEAYTGLAAQKAESYLQEMEEPTFSSPMK